MSNSTISTTVFTSRDSVHTVSRKHACDCTNELRAKCSPEHYVGSKLLFAFSDLDNSFYYFENGVLQKQKQDHCAYLDEKKHLSTIFAEVDSIEEIFEKNKDLKFFLHEGSYCPPGCWDVKRFPAISLAVFHDTGRVFNTEYFGERKETYTVEFCLWGVVHYFKVGDEIVKLYVKIEWHAKYTATVPHYFLGACEKQIDCIYKPAKSLEKGFDFLKDFLEVNYKDSILTIFDTKTEIFKKYEDGAHKDNPYIDVSISKNGEVKGYESHRFVRSRDGQNGGMRELVISNEFVSKVTNSMILNNESVRNFYNKSKELFDAYKANYWEARKSRKKDFREAVIGESHFVGLNDSYEPILLSSFTKKKTKRKSAETV